MFPLPAGTGEVRAPVPQGCSRISGGPGIVTKLSDISDERMTEQRRKRVRRAEEKGQQNGRGKGRKDVSGGVKNSERCLCLRHPFSMESGKQRPLLRQILFETVLLGSPGEVAVLWNFPAHWEANVAFDRWCGLIPGTTSMFNLLW